jgi:hypothetical protein
MMNEKIDQFINAGFPIIMRNREGCAGGAKVSCILKKVLLLPQAMINF